LLGCRADVRADDELSLAEKIARLPQAERDEVFAGYSQADFDSLDFDWGFWGRPEQIAPPGTWDNWLRARPKITFTIDKQIYIFGDIV
jgi:hypothetical protein